MRGYSRRGARTTCFTDLRTEPSLGDSQPSRSRRANSDNVTYGLRAPRGGEEPASPTAPTAPSGAAANTSRLGSTASSAPRESLARHVLEISPPATPAPGAGGAEDRRVSEAATPDAHEYGPWGSPRPSQEGTARLSVKAGERRGSKGYRIPERLADFFDPKGMLPKKAPRFWALQACKVHPLSQSFDAQDVMASLSTRQQQINTDRCISRDQERTDKNIRKWQDLHRQETRGKELEDTQFLRHLLLLFEPLDLTQAMLTELGKAVGYSIHDAPVGLTRLKHVVRTSSVILGVGVLALMQGEVTEGQEDCSKRPVGPVVPAPTSGSTPLSNAQRMTMLSIFQRYVLRVSGPSRLELMRRGTWFRFLHHCGLLGPVAGITFVQAAKVWELFAEKQANPPVLTFLGWSNALQRLLRGPKFFKSDLEMHEQLFGTYLYRCEKRLAGGLEVAMRAIPGSAEARLEQKRPRERRPEVQRYPNPNAVVVIPGSMEEKLSWNILVAEEQMCEPEVVQLIQAHQRPLRELFAHFVTHQTPPPSGALPKPRHASKPRNAPRASRRQSATPAKPRLSAVPTAALAAVHALMPHGPAAAAAHGQQAASPAGSLASTLAVPVQLPEAESDAGALSDEDTPGLEGIVQPSPNSSRANTKTKAPLQDLSLEGFREALCALGMYPEIVQEYNLRQHLSVTVSRYPGATGLGFEGFVESLCRICFAYLGFYANTTQQAAPGKCKCLWMLAMLRLRCRDLGAKLGLPPRLVGEGPEGGELWKESDEHKDASIDSIPLEQLVLWRTLDADLPHAAAPPKGAFKRQTVDKEFEKDNGE